MELYQSSQLFAVIVAVIIAAVEAAAVPLTIAPRIVAAEESTEYDSRKSAINILDKSINVQQYSSRVHLTISCLARAL